MRLNVKAFALACGLVFGIALFLVTWWLILLEGARNDATIIAHVFRGYAPTAVGSLIGLVWAFVSGSIIGAVLAWLYNLMSAKPTVKPA